ncbi:beta-N-acetylhexosaminidase [Roseinatronobacter alkalisoli]|uniref:beta-N-acetylhexosaminidase n=1 Tax=Roseinatronobacter alkalisoli TaxID=3028235 RepID=A0ABT5T7Y2_9RHOB|nr:beta-N-acetylhexosaminidase [Roseinatronobacter sp. HJB301]MDD7971231.1 beta-N-acetylhexosaminidase [Roseinatronobacter sp. HJB301]
MSTAPRAVIFGCEGTRLGAQERRFLARAAPWGAILFARNIETPDQLTALTSDWRDALGRDLPILIDQEGGRVQRMRAPHWREWIPALEQSRRSPDPARAMYLRGRLIAAELHAVGVNVNCAPLADIARAQTHAILHNRCYGQDLETVIACARAMADGLLAGGVLPVLKHIPGHGRAGMDSHLALPVVDTPLQVLEETDFAAFHALADLPLAMSAHLVFSAIDPDLPATISPRMVGLIRDNIGFQGLLMSDDISMQALSGPVAARAIAALQAGCDIVLHCNGDMDEMRSLADTCPPLTTESWQRAQSALAQRNAPDAADTGALQAEYDALLGTA